MAVFSYSQNLFKLVIKIAIVLSTVFAYPFFLLLPFLFVPFTIYRLVISWIHGLVYKKSFGIMAPRNCVVAVDNVATEPEQSIIVNIVLSEVVQFERYYEVIRAAVLGDGNTKYPEFQRYYGSWAGYLFWYPEDHFDFAAHMKLYPGSSEKAITYEELKTFCLSYVRQGFEKAKSPWEILFVERFRHEAVTPDRDTSVILFRAHHGLCDGYSILQFLTDAVQQWDKTKNAAPNPEWSKGAVGPSAGQKCLAMLAAPYYLVREGLGSLDINGFRINGTKLTRKLRVAGLRTSVELVKAAKDKWKVSFSAIVFSAVSGGFQRYMAEKKMLVPEVFHVGMPFPWPNRKPYGLQNSMCVCILKLPVGTEDRTHRVSNAEKYWKDVKSSPVPLINWILMPLLGLLPGPLLKLFVMNNVTTMVLSNFPGPQERVQILNATTEEVEFLTGFWRGNCGIGIALISCNETLKLNLGIDEALAKSQSEVDTLVRYIHEELQILHNENGDLV